MKSRQRNSIEAALLWRDSVQKVEVLRRERVPPRLTGAVQLAYAVSPVTFGLAAAVALLLGMSAHAVALGAGALGLSIYFMMDVDDWRSVLTGALWRLRHGDTVLLGETPGCRFFIASEQLGAREVPLLAPHGRGWALDLGNSLRGQLDVAGTTYTLEEARQTTGRVLLTDTTRCRIQLGESSLLLRQAANMEAPQSGWLARLGAGELSAMATSVLLHLGLLVLFVFMQPDDDLQIRRGKNPMLGRLMAVESIHRDTPEEREEPEVHITQDPTELADQASEPVVQVAESAQAAPTFVANPARAPTLVVRPSRPEHVVKRTSERYIPQNLLAEVTRNNLLRRPGTTGMRLLGGGPGTTGSTFDRQARGGSPTEFGDLEFGNTHGPEGPGGGGPAAMQPVKEKRGFVARKPEFTEKKQEARVILPAPFDKRGELTKDIIRKHIARQKGGIVRCYRKAIQKDPTLQGTVVVRFVIAPTGSVSRQSIVSSTLGSHAVESCMLRRVALWRFPSPKNAGATRVTYPFLFRAR